MIMNYIITSIKKDELKKVEKVFGKYIVTVGEHASWLGDGFVEVAQKSFDRQPTEDEIGEFEKAYYNARLDAAKRDKLAEIFEYNTSENVDGFLLNGTRHWLSLEERKSAKLSTDAHITLGHETTEQYLSGVPYTLPCQTLILMLAQLEVYALECLNNALRQKAEVEALTTVAEVEAYDVTNGYPEMLSFTI